MAMDQFLAEYYGTAQPAQDETEKAAQVELFAKLAAAEGIDLNSMSDEQVEQLYNATFSKEASEEEGEEKDDKKEEAEKEHAEKKAAAEKFAEADYMGRVMAHAYVQEMRKIASSNEKSASMDMGRVSRMRGAVKGVAEKAGKHVENVGRKVVKTVGRTHGEESALSSRTARGIGGATYGAGALGAAGAAKGVHHLATKDKKKKASAIDELAAQHAVEKAAAAGWNAEEAVERLSAVMTLGPSEEGTKVAQAEDVNGAIDIRASELLEQAGYPVDWS